MSSHPITQQCSTFFVISLIFGLEINQDMSFPQGNVKFANFVKVTKICWIPYHFHAFVLWKSWEQGGEYWFKSVRKKSAEKCEVTILCMSASGSHELKGDILTAHISRTINGNKMQIYSES